MRRFLALLAVPALGAVAVALIPAGSGAVPADTTFDGKVNGLSKAVNVTVVCPSPGDTVGIVKAGQNWGIATGTHGQTGDFGGTITASFPGNAGGTSTFSSLGETQAIPATNVLPCSGTSAVTFTPNDFGQDLRTTQVGVKFVRVAS
jgi:hypothetical protein